MARQGETSILPGGRLQPDDPCNKVADHDRFTRLKTLQAEGGSHAAIVRETGLNWRTVAKWTRLEVLPERRTMAPKATTPERFRTYLARR